MFFFRKKRPQIFLSYGDAHFQWLHLKAGTSEILSAGAFDVAELSRMEPVAAVQSAFSAHPAMDPEIWVSMDNSSCEYFYSTFEKGLGRTQVREKIEAELAARFGAGTKDRSYSFQFRNLSVKTCAWGATFPKTLARFLHRFIENHFQVTTYQVVPANFGFFHSYSEEKCPTLFLLMGPSLTSFALVDEEGMKIAKVLGSGYERFVETISKELKTSREESITRLFAASLPGKNTADTPPTPESRALFTEFNAFLKRIGKVIDFSLLAFPTQKGFQIKTLGRMNELENFCLLIGQSFKKKSSQVTEAGAMFSGSHRALDLALPGHDFSFLFHLIRTVSSGELQNFEYQKKFEVEKRAPVFQIELARPLSYALLLLGLATWLNILWRQDRLKKNLVEVSALVSQLEEKTVTFQGDRLKVDLLREKISSLRDRPREISRLAGCVYALASSFVQGIEIDTLDTSDPGALRLRKSNFSFAEFTNLGRSGSGEFRLTGTATNQKILEEFLDAVQSRPAFGRITLEKAEYPGVNRIQFSLRGEYRWP